MRGHGKKTVLIIATLDTKGEEALYLKKGIEAKGKRVLVLDCGLRGKPESVKPDISREEVVRAGGADYKRLKKAGRSAGIEAMAKGVAMIVQKLYEDKRFDGVLSIGGSDGSILGTAGLRELPIGVPKLMVSAMASGSIMFGDYVGTKDVTVMPSVVDIVGVNPITQKVFDNAVGAISGMVDAGVKAEITDNNLIAMSMAGQTTPCGMLGKRLLEKEGFKVIAFHSNSGKAMEEFVEKNVFAGVWDLSTYEVGDELFSKCHSAGPYRLEAAGKKGVPQVVVPGCLGFIWGSPGPPDNFLLRYKSRKKIFFNPKVVLVRLKKEEFIKLAKVMSEKLNKSTGPVTLVLPLKGFSMFNKEGEEFYAPGLNALFFKELKKYLNPRINLIEVDSHINDPGVARTCISVLVKMIRKKKG